MLYDCCLRKYLNVSEISPLLTKMQSEASPRKLTQGSSYSANNSPPKKIAS